MDASIFGNERGSRVGPKTKDDAGSILHLTKRLTGLIRRQALVFATILGSFIFLGLVYQLTTPPRYTSHAMLLIDSSKVRILQQQALAADIPIDTAHVETQLEVLKSETVALAVIKELKLSEDPEFVGGSGGILGWVRSSLSTDEPSDTETSRKALASFLKGRFVFRVGKTYVLDVGFNSLNARRASIVANAIANAYIDDQLEAKYQATRRASVWLQDRIEELRQQVSEADRAVLSYKEKNNIIEVAGPSSTGTRLLGEQQLEELNTQLGTARAAAAEAKARLERIDEVLKKDVPDSTVTDSLRNEVITRLRNNYLDLAGREAIWSARYGHDHLAAVNLRTQMAELRRSIADELGRIAQGYKSDYEIAKSRAESLEKSLEGMVSNSQSINRGRLGLRELESKAQVYHTIYDNFLQRYMEAIQQQSFPITEARVISAAAPPSQKSSPVATSVLGVSAMLGIMFSFAAAAMREMYSQVFRTRRQVESLLNLSCLAVVPALEANSQNDKKETPFQKLLSIGILPLRSSETANQDLSGLNLKQSDQHKFTGESDVVQHSFVDRSVASISSDLAFMRHVLVQPLSMFTEEFRSIKMAALINNLNCDNKVIGITSALPNEGKSTVSSNLAELIADAGKKVILIDGDLRNPSLTRALAPAATAGLLEVLHEKSTLPDVIYFDASTKLSFLPALVKGRLSHSDEVLASNQFGKLMEVLRKEFDYIIIDFPPLAPVVDVRGTCQVVDSFIFVIEWGQTRIELVQNQLASARELCEKTLGVVLNKANLKLLRRYDENYGKKYYKQYGTAYGYSN